MNKKITVVVNGRFHAFDYAAELYKKGMLDKLISTMPYSVAKRYDIGKEAYVGFPIFEVLKRGYRKVFKRELPVLWYAKLFTKFAEKFISNETDVIISFAGYSKEIFESVRLKRAIKVLDRGSTHTLENIKLKKQAGEYHNFIYPVHPENFIERELTEYDLAHYILIPSKFVKRTFKANGIIDEKLIIIPYAFSSKKFQYINTSVSRNNNTVLFVGQLSPRKGTGVLINAMKLVVNKIPDAKLWLVGSIQNGIDMKKLEYDWLSYFGVLKGNDLVAKYQSASLFCLPSFEEGLALVLTEAKTFGMPILATANSGIEDLVNINNSNYMLFEAGNHNDLAIKIEQMLIINIGRNEEKAEVNNSWLDFTNELLNKIHELKI